MIKAQPRLAILSDIHGNLPALEAVLEDVQQHDVDGILVAGDLAGGPQQNETTQRLRSLGCWMIRGNNDTYLLRYDTGKAPAAWYNSLQWAPTRWAYHHIDRETLQFIRTLPEQQVIALPGTAPIRVVHGSPRDPSELIFPDLDPASLDQALDQISESVLVCGHTHHSWVQRRNGRLALNPGAVCGGLDGIVGANYALLTWENNRWQARQKLIPYDLDRIRSAFQSSGLLEEGGALARAFLLSIETGQNVGWSLVKYAYQVAQAAGIEANDAVPNAIWEQAVEMFNWDRARRGERQPAPVLLRI